MDSHTRQDQRTPPPTGSPTATSKSPYRDSVIGLDPITGIANRRLFEYQGEKAFSMALRHNDDLGLVVFRLENLESIAADSGVPAAKQLLQTFANQLSENARIHDTTGRLSRSRFGVLLPGAREFGAHKFAVRLLSILRGATESERTCVISAAVTATNSRSCDRYRELHDHASQRLEDAVLAGGNRLVSSFCQ